MLLFNPPWITVQQVVMLVVLAWGYQKAGLLSQRSSGRRHNV